MKARLFGTIALVMLPTVAFAIDAGNTSGKTNETTPTTELNKMKPDDAKAAGTGGGKGAANATSTEAIMIAAPAMLEPTEQPQLLRPPRERPDFTRQSDGGGHRGRRRRQDYGAK